THIRLQPNKQRSGKKKKRIIIPVGAPLKEALDARRSEKAEGSFAKLVRRFMDKRRLPRIMGEGVRSRKARRRRSSLPRLRGSAVTRLALAGCTTAKIAAITGHSPRDVDEILKAHYLGGQAELAEQAIVKLVATFG